MINNTALTESTMSLSDVYYESCKMIYKDDQVLISDPLKLDIIFTDRQNGFDKRKQKLSKKLPLDLNIFFTNPDYYGYAFPEITALLLAAYLSEDQRSSCLSSKIFTKEKKATITPSEKQEFLSKVVDRLEKRHKDDQVLKLIKPKLEKIKTNYEDNNHFEKNVKTRIVNIKKNLNEKIDERLQNVGALFGLNEYLFNSTIEKIKRKEFSINDFLDIANVNDADSVGLTEIFEKDSTGHLKINHSETKMQLTREDRMKVIDKFEEFLTDAMDNWTVYLEEFERERHEEYHRKFKKKCTEANDHEILAFTLPKEILSDNLETSAEKKLMNLQYYSSIQETDSGLIANIQLATDVLETTEFVNQKAMTEYNLMLYDYLINTQTAVSAKHYDNIVNFDRDGLNYANHLKQQQNNLQKTPPSDDEICHYTAVTIDGDIFYRPIKSPEEVRQDYFLYKKNSEERQMYIDNLMYREHLGDHEAEKKIDQLFAEDPTQIDSIQTNYALSHFGEYYVLSDDLRSECHNYIEKKLASREKLKNAMSKKDRSIDILFGEYNSLTPPYLLVQAMAYYVQNISQSTYAAQLAYILSKKLNVRNPQHNRTKKTNGTSLINWRDVYVYNKNGLIFIPYDLILPNITVRKVRKTNLKKYNRIMIDSCQFRPKKPHPEYRLKFHLMIINKQRTQFKRS